MKRIFLLCRDEKFLRFLLLRSFLSVLIFALFCFVAGCNSFGERHVLIRADFERGQIDKAKSKIDRAITSGKKGEVDVLKLNSAIIELCSGNPKSAELLLREVRDKFDRLERERAVDTLRDAASLLSDDTVRAYSGEDYEKVLIRVFLAIANLMQEGADARAYALQINDKQNKIIQERTSELKKWSKNNSDLTKSIAENYKQVAIGAYLSGLLQEETQQNYDEARRAYETVAAWEPDFVQAKVDLERVNSSVHSRSGNGVVYVIGLVGTGPYKLQQNCEVLRDAQIITTALLNVTTKMNVVVDFSPIKIPVIVRSAESVPSIAVAVNAKPCGTTETITNIGQMAEDQFNVNKSQIIARAIVRRAIKKGSVLGAAEAIDANIWINIAMQLAGGIWQAVETADTRCWNLLPAEIQIQRIELPAGLHDITLQPISRVFSTSKKGYITTNESKYLGQKTTIPCHVVDGRNTYILANFQNNNLVGRIVTRTDGLYHADKETEDNKP
ncbi:MAG: hypothetical protein LBQ66_13680 [Planctomycetaceae bacterium]|jgi:hypothetical protein|nr:hypothetical protein [Planctomycetaceae bacterium]